MISLLDSVKKIKWYKKMSISVHFTERIFQSFDLFCLFIYSITITFIWNIFNGNWSYINSGRGKDLSFPLKCLFHVINGFKSYKLLIRKEFVSIRVRILKVSRVIVCSTAIHPCFAGLCPRTNPFPLLYRLSTRWQTNRYKWIKIIVFWEANFHFLLCLLLLYTWFTFNYNSLVKHLFLRKLSTIGFYSWKKWRKTNNRLE